MKSLNQTDIGKRDQGWSIAPLHSITEDPQYGHTSSASDKGNTKLLRITDINGFSIDWQRVPFCQCDKDIFNKYRLFENDILIARIGATTGKSCIVKKAPDAVFASYLIRICAKNNTDADYLYFFFQSDEYWRQINQNKNNNLKKGVNASVLKSLKVPLPPTIDEQRRIAAILSTVQRAIEQQERLIALTTELKKALMHKLFSEGTRGEPQKETEIGLVPESWSVGSCDALCKSITVGVVVRPKSYYVSEGIPAFRSFNVREDFLNTSDLVYFSPKDNDNKLSKSKLHTGDVLIVRTGYPGTSCVVPKEYEGSNCIDLVIARPGESILSDFLSRFFNSSGCKRQVLSVKHGLAQQHLNVGAVKKILIPVPSKNEQADIVNTLKKVDLKVEHHKSRRNTYSDLFRTLLHQLMTAQIRVNDIDLSELGIEPAAKTTAETAA